MAAGTGITAVSVTAIWEFDHNGIFYLIQIAGVAVLVAGLRVALLA